VKQLVRTALLALSLFSVPVFAEAPEEPEAPVADETLTLRRGKSKDLVILDVHRIAIGDPKCADVRTMGGNVIRIKGKKAGETTIIIWTGGNVRRVYRVVVR